MPIHQWELRADVRPLDLAALRWSEVGQLMSQRADDLVGAARHALDGWDAAAAESYEHHRRQVIANLDRFTTLAAEVSRSVQALSAMITASQKELDQAWLTVSLVPHQVVGPERRLVFQEADDADRGKVTRGELEATEIRRRLTLSLDQESSRLRTARAEFMLVRASLDELVGRAFPALLRTGIEASGVGLLGPASTSVRGTAESGVGVGVGVGVALAPIGPISVSMPSLSGLATTGLAPVIGMAASGRAGRRSTDSGSRLQGSGMPMGVGMAAGAMRGGTTARGGAAGRRTGGSSGSLLTPRLVGKDDAARSARDKDAAKQAASEAKREAIAEKRAERAARKAAREAEREEERTGHADEDVADGLDGDDAVEGAVSRPAQLTVVEIAPDEPAEDARL